MSVFFSAKSDLKNQEVEEEHALCSVCCGFLSSCLAYGCLVIMSKTSVGSMSTPPQSLLAFRDFLSDEIMSHRGT